MKANSGKLKAKSFYLQRQNSMERLLTLFTETKPLLVTLFCIFIISSCKKPENLCTLTPEQAPEIRGVKLGMSYDEVAERFHIKCNLNVINHSPGSHLYEKSRYSISINDVDFNNRVAIKETDKYDLKGSDTGCFTYLGKNIIGFSPSKFPELQGIESLDLSFDGRKSIVRSKASYGTKSNEKFTLQKLFDSLDLSKWTNWYIEPEIDTGDGIPMSRGTLLYNNLVIESTINYFSNYGNTYSVRLDVMSTTDEELKFTRDSIAKAQQEKEQKKRDEAENINAARKKRMEEENKVREPFKP